MPDDAYATHKRTEQLTVHVLWMTGGLGCDGDTLAMASGPVFRYFRGRNLAKLYEREPEWRRPQDKLTTGYPERWSNGNDR